MISRLWRRRCELLAISATASSKTASLCAAGWLNPEIFRTNCRAAASISSSGAGWAPSRSLLIERHMGRSYNVGRRTRFSSSEARTKTKAMMVGTRPPAAGPARSFQSRDPRSAASTAQAEGVRVAAGTPLERRKHKTQCLGRCVGPGLCGAPYFRYGALEWYH